MWVKICGTTSLRDAQLAVSAGADAVGFVFAPSKRRVDASQAAAIISAMPDAVEKTGVFSVPDAGEIASVVREAGLTSVQMHFLYDVAVVASLRAALGEEVKLLQVITCPVESLDEMALRQEVALSIVDPNIWAILLDASTQGASGGTGRSFDWQRVAGTLDDIWPERHSGTGTKLILAGGLRQENVREAVGSLRPFGVDIVSGVEAAPGTKDEDRVRAFVDAAKH